MSQIATKFFKDNAVTNAKLAQMAAHTYKGNNTGSTANVLDVTSIQLTADLNLFTTSLQGLVPGSGGGTTNFLRADGTWAAPTGTGTVTTVSVVSANGLAGTVANASTTPALTLSTTITGILQGNGTAISAATTTGSGSVVLATAPTLSNPVVGTQSQNDNSTKGASTAYVDLAVANAIAGVNPAVAVKAATTAASDTSGFTYNNGVSGVGATFTGSTNTAVTIDGYTFTAIGQRLLVKNDTQSPSGAFNGVYSVTQVQTGLLPPILTRALDYDQPSDINNTGAIPVINGTVNGTTQWVLITQVNTVGTDPLTYTKFSANPASYLLAANNLSDVANKTTSFNNLSPMTTNGDIIYGGASGTGTRLAIGATNQVLTVIGGIPSWQTPGGSSSTVYVRFTMEGEAVPFTCIDGCYYVRATNSVASANISALNSGNSGSTVFQINQWRSGALQASVTGSLSASSGNTSGTTASLSSTLSVLSGDILTVDCNSVALGSPSDFSVEPLFT